MINELKNKNYFIAIINGSECEKLDQFLKKIGEAFHFPSYYGQNINALCECINDLSWIDNENYALIIKNNNSLLSKESSSIKEEIFSVLEDAKEEWSNVPNFDGEEKYRAKADFKVLSFENEIYD
jgi:RNAse (barnase) inhibitor barstar